jgi:hypothetical protein
MAVFAMAFIGAVAIALLPKHEGKDDAVLVAGAKPATGD